MPPEMIGDAARMPPDDGELVRTLAVRFLST